MAKKILRRLLILGILHIQKHHDIDLRTFSFRRSILSRQNLNQIPEAAAFITNPKKYQDNHGHLHSKSKHFTGSVRDTKAYHELCGNGFD